LNSKPPQTQSLPVTLPVVTVGLLARSVGIFGLTNVATIPYLDPAAIMTNMLVS
jgi:hypothetical protein